MIKNRWVNLIALLTALSLVLAACGDGDGETTETTVTTGTTETTAAGEGGTTTAPGSPDDMSMDELIAAAQEEGQLTIQLSGGQEPAAQYAQVFSDKFGIPVFVASFGGSENFEKTQVGMEAGRPVSDITIQTSVNRMRHLSDQGWLEEYTPAADPNIPDAMKDSGQWYAPFINSSAIAWSTVAVTPEEEELLTSVTNEELWDLLNDPMWTDRVVITPPHTGGGDLAWYYYVMVEEADTLGEAYLEELAALNPAIVTNGRTAVERMTAGEWAIFHGGSVSETLMSSFYASDAPIRWRFFEPTIANVWGMGIAKGAENPNAAKLWMEWMLSVEGQEALGCCYLVAPVNSEAADTRTVASEPWFTPAETFYTGWLEDPQLDDPDWVEENLFEPFEEIFEYTPEG